MDNFIVVSTDSHGGPRPADYGQYLDPEYRDRLDLHLKDMEVIKHALNTIAGYPFSAEDLEFMDERNAIRSGGESGAHDPQRRLQEVEAEGVCAEIIHPGTQGNGPGIFFEIMTSKYSPELRAAGARAHNRWLAEYCAAAPGRLIGSALIEPWPDMSGAVAELTRARESGLKVIWTDQFAGLEGEAPSLGTPAWDPLWAACVDLDVIVHIHIGFGSPQGGFQEFETSMRETLGDQFDDFAANVAPGDLFDPMLFPSRRPLWQLMWGGAFDRHPGLKVAFAEQHAYWLPPTLDYLDRRHANEAHSTMKLKPSEYWQRNCSVAATSLRPTDLAIRHQIGVDHMTFATDYPHLEGTWPNTLNWLRATLVDIPEDEARLILGENAIQFYGLDRALLEGVAARIGPRPEDILGQEKTVPPGLIEHFDKRSGYSKAPMYSEDELAYAVDEDLAALASS